MVSSSENGEFVASDNDAESEAEVPSYEDSDFGSDVDRPRRRRQPPRRRRRPRGYSDEEELETDEDEEEEDMGEAFKKKKSLIQKKILKIQPCYVF